MTSDSSDPPARPAPDHASQTTESGARRAMKLAGMTVEPHDLLARDLRVAFFIDVRNTEGAAASLGFHIDYPKAIENFLGLATFADAYFYVPEGVFDHKRLTCLAHQGFIIRTPPYKLAPDPLTGERWAKTNVDGAIILDMLVQANTYDVAYLFSGDSDLEHAARYLQERGRRVHLVTSRAACSTELLYTVHKPVFFLEDFRDLIERPDTKTAAEARPRA